MLISPSVVPQRADPTTAAAEGQRHAPHVRPPTDRRMPYGARCRKYQLRRASRRSRHHKVRQCVLRGCRRACVDAWNKFAPCARACGKSSGGRWDSSSVLPARARARHLPSFSAGRSLPGPRVMRQPWTPPAGMPPSSRTAHGMAFCRLTMNVM